MPQQQWLILHYSLPSEPSAARVKIWRKLKRLGAIPLLDSGWILPDRPRSRELAQWLAAEILELGGQSALWVSSSLSPGVDEALVERFQALVEPEYADLLKRLEDRECDLELLAREYLRLQQEDYFGSPKGLEVRARLLLLRGDEA